MTNPTNGGWEPDRDPYEPTPPPTPPPYQRPPAQNPPAQNPSYQRPAQNPPAQNPPAQNPPAQNLPYEPSPPPFQAPPYGNPAYQNPAAQNPAAQNPAAQNPAAQNPAAQNPAYPTPGYPTPGYGPAPDPNAGGAWSSAQPPPGAYGSAYPGQFGGGSPPPGSHTNRIIIAVTAVVVAALVVIGIVVSTQDKKSTADRSHIGTASTVVSSSAVPSTSASSSAVPSTTASSTDPPSPSTTSGISNKDQLCTDPMAQTDLIHLTVSLGFVSSYKAADAYEKGIIDDCATPAVIKQLSPYFGKTLGLPNGDLTGGNGTGATARYSVQLVNTSTYISFTMDRRSSGGYRVVAVSSR